MKVLLVAPNVDGTDVGEAFVAFKWAEALAARCDLTVLSFSRAGRTPLAEQLPAAEVVTFPEPRVLRRFERFNAMLKPAYPLYWRAVRRFVRGEQAKGRTWDVAHQLMPNAGRYPSPLPGLNIPYLIGPVGGSLTTPPAFAAECGGARWYTRARGLDGLRYARDPWLRRGYQEAELVMGVAPYMRDVFGAIPLKRFETMLEIGVDALGPSRPARERAPGELRLLHVGRGVRTKGLRDAVRAMQDLKDEPGVTLTSAGDGEELAVCKAEAERLGVADKVTFLGRRPRAEVEQLYQDADIFFFPSFREPAGGVLLEAMRWGLPVVTARRGGPDFIVDETCGLKVDVTSPEQMPRDLAAVVRRLIAEPDCVTRLGEGARRRTEAIGLWHRRADAMLSLYAACARPGAEAA